VTAARRATTVRIATELAIVMKTAKADFRSRSRCSSVRGLWLLWVELRPSTIKPLAFRLEGR